jgi:dihydrofolate synthase/folylpolyglutamate synthase
LDEIYHTKWTAVTVAKLEVFKEAVRHFWPGAGAYPVKLIQVAGTSGKGSTCQFLQAGLSLFGRAGCYVKPHVFDYTERFVVENKRVEREEILKVWNDDVKPYCVKNALRGEPWLLDHPQASLLMALRIFERHRLRWAAIETGIGGRYDPATCLEVVMTVLTNVGKDHEATLGSEHWQRALEKSGVCRSGVPLVLGDDNERTIEVVSAICRDVGTPLHRVTSKDRKSLTAVLNSAGQKEDVGMVLGSRHQLQNSALAAKVITTLVKDARLSQIAGRFLKMRYVGRFWKIEEGVFADVAHNPSKTEALAQEIEGRFPGQRKIFVVGISGPRKAVEVIGPLVAQAKAMVVTSAGYKGQDPDKVYSLLREAYPTLPIHLATDPRSTLKVAKNLRDSGETIIFTGSTYMVDQALNSDEKLRHLNGTYGWREKAARDLGSL